IIAVDTGFGAADVALPERLPRGFRALSRPTLEPRETLVSHLRRLGLDPRELRHIVVTHLDLDHAGAIADFPEATVHVHAREHAAAHARATFRERRRYLPCQFSDHRRWELYGDDGGDEWMGLRALRPLRGLGADVALVPLHGHTRGHSGVAVRGADRWLLHAGDAYFSSGQLADPPRCPPGLAVFERFMAVDERLRRANQERLRTLHRDPADEVADFCAQDAGALHDL